MYKAGDPKNPFDPASMDLSKMAELGMSELLDHFPVDIGEWLNKPENVEKFNQHQRERAAELARTGETQWDRMLREKHEWAAMDARSRKLKDEGNVAFRKGDFKTAYVIYTVCMEFSVHEPLYPLNRAAVALKLKLYELAIKDTSIVIERHKYKGAKAHFRRGQALCFLGDWAGADEDYTKALALEPDEKNIHREIDQLKRLRGLSPADRAAWIAPRAPVKLQDVFEPGELECRTEEVRKRS
ncbi:TPR-like protein [Mycena crocata]|nr:TPR-like protein [Mycena crocata]